MLTLAASFRQLQLNDKVHGCASSLASEGRGQSAVGMVGRCAASACGGLPHSMEVELFWHLLAEAMLEDIQDWAHLYPETVHLGQCRVACAEVWRHSLDLQDSDILWEVSVQGLHHLLYRRRQLVAVEVDNLQDWKIFVMEFHDMPASHATLLWEHRSIGCTRRSWRPFQGIGPCFRVSMRQCLYMTLCSDWS